MAATAGASHHQAAEFRLVNGQLVTADGGPPTVEAPAEPAGGPRDCVRGSAGLSPGVRRLSPGVRETVSGGPPAESGGPRDGDMVEPDAVIINLELQEWKRLARIMDRLFFWMTLTALISISVVLSCLLMWQG